MIRYLQNSIENMRDIGGYKNNEGRVVKLGKLIRSNWPINLSNEDISIIKKMGINTIIDLRSYGEIKTRKSVFEDNKDFHIYHIGMNIGKNIPEEEELVSKSYIEMLTLQKEIKKIFEILSKSDRIIYFCNAGKDRTGVITALILKLLGVSEKDIIDDYMYTKIFMKEILKEYANNNTKILNIITPKRIYMQKFLEEFEDLYGSIEKYLDLIGIEENIIKNIKQKFIG